MDLVNVAYKIKQLRLKQQMTIDQLAARCGLSKGYISRVENFRTGASLRALNVIATALGVEVIELFRNENAAPEIVFGNLGSGERIDRNQADEYAMAYYALAFEKTDRTMNPFIIEYRPAGKSRELLQHDSQEFFVLLEGEIEFVTGSCENHRLMKAGDTVYLNSAIPHSARLAPACEYAKALVIYH